MVMRRSSSELLIGGRRLSLSPRWPRVARLADEWFEDVDDPAAFVHELKAADVPADVFSFWQRLPTTEPRYHYHCEWEETAVLQVSTFDDWYKNQINNKTRNLIVKAKKRGIEVRPAEFDDAFVRGMTAIF